MTVPPPPAVTQVRVLTLLTGGQEIVCKQVEDGYRVGYLWEGELKEANSSHKEHTV